MDKKILFVGIVGICIGILLINLVVGVNGNNNGSDKPVEHNLSIIKESNKVTIVNTVMVDNKDKKDKLIKNTVIQEKDVNLPEAAKEHIPLKKMNVTIGEAVIVKHNKTALLKDSK